MKEIRLDNMVKIKYFSTQQIFFDFNISYKKKTQL